jgi:hypothetical protein
MQIDDPQLLLDGTSIDWTPGHLARLMASVSQSGLTCGEVVRLIVDRFEARSSNLAASLLAIADRAERSGTANPFHNPQHSRDVGVIWINLALANNILARSGEAPFSLTDHQIILGACAAFGHDIGHDGTTNSITTTGPDGVMRRERIAFRLEMVAANCVRDILHAHGTIPADIEVVRAAILATDVVDGYAALESALACFDSGEAARPVGDFAAFRDPAATLIAAILRDADVLPSAGFGACQYDRNTALLEDELEIARNGISAPGAEEFFGRVLGGRFISPPGKLFQPHLDDLRALNRLRWQRPGGPVNLRSIEGREADRR